MTSKYNGLPDIDTAQDIFETVDEPESALRPSDGILESDSYIVRPTSEGIDGSGLPARRKAEKVFGRGSRRPDPSLSVSFRPRLPPLGHRRSSSSSSSESSHAPKETPAARIRRLKAELAEVEQEIQAGPSSASTTSAPQDEAPSKRKSVLPPRPPVDLLSELTGLRNRLESINIDDIPRRSDTVDHGSSEAWKARIRNISASAEENGTKPGGNDDQERRSNTGEAPGLTDLDKRLASLEQLIGPSEASLEANSAPVIATLTKLDHLLSLLTQPRHLDAISRRVKLLLVDLDRAQAASRRAPNAPGAGGSASQNPPLTGLGATDQQSLQALFALLPRLDPLLPLIPTLLARLRSLSGLHAQAADVATGLEKLKEGEKRDMEEIQNLQQIVRGVESGLKGAGEAVEKNWTSLDAKMTELQQRLKALDAA